MPTWALQLIAVLALITAVAALMVARRADLRARLRTRRLERTSAENLHILKALEAHRLADQLRREGHTPALPVTCRATGGEDLWLLELFNPPGRPLKTQGFYIECGGFDGLNKSVTWAFDALGWDGLLVEPLPHLADAARRNRPRARVEQAAVAERGSTGTARFVHVAGNDPAFEGSSHLSDRNAKDVKSAPMDSAREIEVPLTTMANLLKDHSGTIDLLVLDVEGAEPRVLDGLELSRHKPRVMLIEDHTLGESDALLRLLEPAGYRHVTWVGRNRLLILSSETELLANAERLAQATAVKRVRI